MIAPGEPLAPFALPDPRGRLQRWQPGHATVIVVVAFWCDTWKTQTVRLAAAHAALRGLPVDTVVVAVDGRWTERGPTPLTPWRDLDGAWSRSLRIQAVPFTLVVDPKGTVRHAQQGITRSQELTAVVRLALAPAPPAGVVWLTFDDFPNHDDDLLLDILRRYRATASFFCLGAHLSDPTNAAIARRALVEGHALEVHSWDHDSQNPQLERCVVALKALGAHPKLYRPPGHTELSYLDGRPLPRPTVTPYDDTRPGEAELRRRLRHALRPGMVVLLHAGVAQTRTVLPELLASLPGPASIPPAPFLPLRASFVGGKEGGAK